MCVPVLNVLAHKLLRVHQLLLTVVVCTNYSECCDYCMLLHVPGMHTMVCDIRTYIHVFGDVLFSLWCSHLLHTQSMRVTLKMDIPHNEHSHIIGVRGKTVRQGQESV